MQPRQQYDAAVPQLPTASVPHRVGIGWILGIVRSQIARRADSKDSGGTLPQTPDFALYYTGACLAKAA